MRLAPGLKQEAMSCRRNFGSTNALVSRRISWDLHALTRARPRATTPWSTTVGTTARWRPRRGPKNSMVSSRWDPMTICGDVYLPELRAMLRAQVLVRFPDAAARSDLPHPAFSIIVNDVGSGELIVTPIPGRH